MKPYPAYKDSGVEWLGMVPEGWEVVPVKVPLSIIGGTTPKSDNPDFWDGDIHWITPADLSNLPDRFVRESGRRITELGLNSCGTTLVPAGAIALSTRAPIGSIAITKVDACTNQGCRLLLAKDSGLSGFFYYVLLSTREQLNLLGRGSTFLELSGDQLGAFRVPLPSLPEQQAIVAFLDRETAKIDGLIEEQRRLIALLAEKRQATISHAVTKGLNPSARLKPSGVDWLGNIPEGWEVVPLKTCVSYQEGPGIMAADFHDDGIPLLRIAGVRGRWATLEGCNYLDPELVARRWSHFRLSIGDLVISASASMGTVSEVDEKTSGSIPYTGLIRLAPDSSVLNRDFLRAFVVSAPFAQQIELMKSGAMIQHYGPTHLSSVKLALPSLDEQERIASRIEAVGGELDSLTETATTAITLLQERRAALISAAVTGKIDVREVAKVPAQAPQSLHVSAMVAGVIIARHGRHLGFGRMMVQKFLFMTQACANAPEIGGDYDRQAAGPFDRDLQNRVEADLEAAGLVRVRQEGGAGARVQYEFLGDATALRAQLARALCDRMERFDYLSNQLGGLSKNGIEAVATLYAAWNDFLIDGQSPSQDDIIREVLEHWHPEKARKFTKADLGTWLDWMQRQNIVPDGTGPHTQTGRLFR